MHGGKRDSPTPEPALRVGVVWSGSRTNPAGSYRSIPIDALAPLAAVPGVVFVDLQKDDPDHAFAGSPLAAAGVDWTRELVDFADTAALISVLDVVITIDTAVAHLAGALGKDVWLLLVETPRLALGKRRWNDPLVLDRSGSYARPGRETGRMWSHDAMRCWNERITFEASANAGVAKMYEGEPGQGVRDLQRAVDLDPRSCWCSFQSGPRASCDGGLDPRVRGI